MFLWSIQSSQQYVRSWGLYCFVKNRPTLQNPYVTIGNGVLRPVSAQPPLMEEEPSVRAHSLAAPDAHRVDMGYLPYSYLPVPCIQAPNFHFTPKLLLENNYTFSVLRERILEWRKKVRHIYFTKQCFKKNPENFTGKQDGRKWLCTQSGSKLKLLDRKNDKWEIITKNLVLKYFLVVFFFFFISD